MTKLPRVYENNRFARILHPISLSITQNIIPLDTATVTLPNDEQLTARSYVELFTPYGSAGMFRVRSPHDAYGQETTTAELEHMISEVGDYIVKDNISEMLPANTAMQRIFSHYKGSKWQLGTVSALGSDQIACQANYSRVLDNMLAILEQKPNCMMSFDFTTTPWTVKIVKKGTTVTAEGRLARNVSTATVTSDDSELCTRVWYQTFNNDTGTWTYKDADTRSMYGTVEGTVRTSSDMTANEINATVNNFLDEHKHPRISVNIQAQELSNITGESIDKFTVGKLMRLNIAEMGITQEETITSVVWEDVYGNPDSVIVNLGAEEDTVVTFLHNLDSKGRGGGGGGRARDEQEEEWKEYYTTKVESDKLWGWYAYRQDQQGSILEQAGLELNSQGLLVYADTANGLSHQFTVLNNSLNSTITNTKNGLQSQIDQQAGEIALKVNKNGVISAINVSGEGVVISANKINLQGYVKAEDITANYINAKISQISTLTGQNATFSGQVSANNVVGNAYISGREVYASGRNISNPVVSVKVTSSGDTYTLTARTADGNYDSYSFSRATTLSGAWSGGKYTVTASPQGETITSGNLNVKSSSRVGDLIYLSINSGNTATGFTAYTNWKNLLTAHSGCVSGLSVYSTSQITLYYRSGEDSYRSAGTHVWYYKDTYTAASTYYN